MWNDLTTKERYNIYRSRKKLNPEASYMDIQNQYNTDSNTTIGQYDDGGYISQNQGTIRQGANKQEQFGRYVSNTLGNAGLNLPLDALRDLGMDIPVSSFTPTGYHDLGYSKSLQDNFNDLMYNTTLGVTSEIGAGMMANTAQKLADPINRYIVKPTIDGVKSTITRPIRNYQNSRVIKNTPDVSIDVLPSYAKPNYKGDQLDLTKERLQNGGFDKVGIQDDLITIPDVGKIKYNPNLSKSKYEQLQDGYKNNNVVKTDNRRKILSDSQAIYSEQPSFDPSADAFYDPRTTTYTIQPNASKDLYNIDKSVVNQHEFSHMIDDFKDRQSLVKSSNGGYVDIASNNKARYSENLTDIPSFDDSYTATNNYFRNNNATELNARGTQIKNYFGLTDTNMDITPDMWNYAKKNYVKDVGMDNNMTDMFRQVKDPKPYLDWLNPRIPTLLPLVPTITNRYNEE